MKLHLPKLLCVAVMAAFAIPAMGASLTADDIVTPTEGGNSYLNVGMENSTDTWAGNLVIGDTSTSTGDVDYVGAFNDSWGWVTPNGGKTNTTITSGLKVTGSLTVQGNGKVELGGQYMGGNYTGLEATDGISVTGGNLTSAKIVTTDLNVSGGTISTSTANCTSGNSYAGGPKQSYIKNSLTISGGALSFGYTANVQGIGGGGHRMTAFGNSSSFTMNQTGGTMRVYGDMDLRAGSTITQKENGGLMVLRDTIYMGNSGTTTFNQSADAAKLVIGRFESTSKYYENHFVINQSGDGLIHLAYGSNLAKEGTITLNQTGDGIINLGGGHDTGLTGALPSRGYALDTPDTAVSSTSFEGKNTTYNIDQTAAGTINVKSNAAITAETVNVGKDATLNVDGHVTITGKASLDGTVNVGATASFTLAESSDMVVTTNLGLATGNSISFYIDDVTGNGNMQMSDEGNLAFTGGSLELNLTDAALTQMAAEAHMEGKEYHITLIDNLSDADVVELETIINDALTLEEYYAELPVTLADATAAPITIESTELILEDNALKAVVIATNPNVIPEPTTATLSLLALAALAARRRRK
ncbi:MAG: hypothetical protein E7031_04435 [Akkermansiaceae bacterium]|nr:hypothetical protein [Akkermansiaceae bacterium]